MPGGKGFAKAGQSLFFGIVLIQSAQAVTTANAQSGTGAPSGTYGCQATFVTVYSITDEHKKLAFRP